MNRIESDRMNRTDWIESETTIGSNRILNRIESDRIGPNGLNRTDWIESETKNFELNQIELNQI